jgi:hypothetical protein
VLTCEKSLRDWDAIGKRFPNEFVEDHGELMPGIFEHVVYTT